VNLPSTACRARSAFLPLDVSPRSFAMFCELDDSFGGNRFLLKFPSLPSRPEGIFRLDDPFILKASSTVFFQKEDRKDFPALTPGSLSDGLMPSALPLLGSSLFSAFLFSERKGSPPPLALIVAG